MAMANCCIYHSLSPNKSCYTNLSSHPFTLDLFSDPLPLLWRGRYWLGLIFSIGSHFWNVFAVHCRNLWCHLFCTNNGFCCEILLLLSSLWTCLFLILDPVVDPYSISSTIIENKSYVHLLYFFLFSIPFFLWRWHDLLVSPSLLVHDWKTQPPPPVDRRCHMTQSLMAFSAEASSTYSMETWLLNFCFS